jgi:hypothetical protein
MRPDQSQHTRPRHNRIHLGEKLTQRLLLLHRVEETGKGGLLGHRRGSIFVPDRVSQIAQQARFFRRSLMMQPVNKKGENPQGNRASEAFDECSQEVIAPSCLFELHAV